MGEEVIVGPVVDRGHNRQQQYAEAGIEKERVDAAAGALSAGRDRRFKLCSPSSCRATTKATTITNGSNDQFSVM